MTNFSSPFRVCRVKFSHDFHIILQSLSNLQHLRIASEGDHWSLAKWKATRHSRRRDTPSGNSLQHYELQKKHKRKSPLALDYPEQTRRPVDTTTSFRL